MGIKEKKIINKNINKLISIFSMVDIDLISFHLGLKIKQNLKKKTIILFLIGLYQQNTCQVLLLLWSNKLIKYAYEKIHSLSTSHESRSNVSKNQRNTSG